MAEMEIQENEGDLGDFLDFDIKAELVKIECEETTQQVETEAEIYEKYGQLHSTLVIKEENDEMKKLQFEFVNIKQEPDDNDKDIPDTSNNTPSGTYCNFCNKIFESQEKFTAHMEQSHVNKNNLYSCNKCLHTFKNIYEKNNHLGNNHSELRPFKCSKCEKSFKHNYNLINHLEIHNELLNFYCNLCDMKKFKTKIYLKRHMRTIHSDEVFPFSCDKCGISLKTNIDLRQHETEHNTIISFRCNLCDIPFQNVPSLLDHMKLNHNNIHPFSCSQCGKSFKSKHYLKSHEVIHDSNISFKCHLCNVQCKQKNNLFKHIKRIHSEERLFKCDSCEKAFKGNNCLNRHKLIHDIVPKFKCHLCKSLFKQRGGLSRHLKRVHK